MRVKVSLALTNPTLISEWDFEKNSITPEQVTRGMGIKVWWKCNKGHEWEASIHNRSRGRGCPYCAGQMIENESSLQVMCPELSSQWDYEKNYPVTPDKVFLRSNKPVWWLCKQGHSWQSPPNQRFNWRKRKQGVLKITKCPTCRDEGINNFLIDVWPDIASQWNHVKNPIPLETVTTGSSRKFWWICNKVHEWEAAVSDRVKGKGCPYCSNKKVSLENSLLTTDPELCKQWNHERNTELKPNFVTRGSGKNVWWKCSIGHEWQAKVSDRVRGNGCPYCSNRKVSIENCLSSTDPSLVKQWDYVKNAPLTPDDVTAGSGKYVWWICEFGHSWTAQVVGRKVNGCPFCAKKVASDENNIAKLYPELLREWDFTKNSFNPKEILAGCPKKAWWVCPKGHEWQQRISHRTLRGNGCPYCSGRYATKENNLAEQYPELLNEWNTEKNYKEPCEYKSRSSKKVWWKCKNGHEWTATISSRTKGNGCMLCNSAKHTSLPEQIIYYYTKRIFGEVVNRFRHDSLNGKGEIDVYIKKYNIAIEYDGYYFHRKRFEKDFEKNEVLKKEGITVFRIRERKLKVIPNCYSLIHNYVNYADREYFESLKLLIKEVLDYIQNHFSVSKREKNKIQRFDSLDLYSNNSDVISHLYYKTIEDSLFSRNIKVAEEWHPTKNGHLAASNVKPQSSKRIWWLCQNGHEWQAIVSDRTRGRGCPYCSNKKPCEDNSLQKAYPELAAQWNYVLNYTFTPNDVLPSAGKKYWWVCDQGHSWKASPNSRRNYRTGKLTKCPICRSKQV